MKTPLLLAIALLSAATQAGCGRSDANTPSAPDTAGRVARGSYIVNSFGCTDCHTPFKLGPNGPEKDNSRFLSGHPEDLPVGKAPKLEGAWAMAADVTNTAFAGPWGISYAMNLTPDPNTGIGIWDEDRFVRAIRTGRHWGDARPINPPMPWDVIRNMTDEDLKSIYAYLRTIPPVVNHVPDYEPPDGLPR
ncbi:MAG: diheme cytochrome c-553 [Planctomycetia bacterium]|nr:diheme cytochrome c-553 [Planctomycetia bacterium]